MNKVMRTACTRRFSSAICGRKVEDISENYAFLVGLRLPCYYQHGHACVMSRTPHMIVMANLDSRIFRWARTDGVASAAHDRGLRSQSPVACKVQGCRGTSVATWALMGTLVAIMLRSERKASLGQHSETGARWQHRSSLAHHCQYHEAENQCHDKSEPHMRDVGHCQAILLGKN
jgi:hypothetical protein